MRISDHHGSSGFSTDDDDDDENIPPLKTDVPSVPNRDLGTGGTREVDKPKNTGDLGEEAFPEPPD
jgi:hypothetical protein